MKIRSLMSALLAVTLCPGAIAAEEFARAAKAADRAAASDPACSRSRLGDFYWEIGDATRVLASGAQGGDVNAQTVFPIASASKFIFGAYVLQKKGGEAVRSDASLHDGLRFTSGYTDFRQLRCFGQRTVGGCFSAGFRGNARANPKSAGHFYYQGGHDQKLAAVDMGMADMDAQAFMREVAATLHLDPALKMAERAVMPAGGMQGNAAAYASFLRGVLRGDLVIGAHLGEDAVCAQPSACPAEPSLRRSKA